MTRDTKQKARLAVDLGASGGKIFAALTDGDTFELTEAHRFDIEIIITENRYYWNFFEIYNQILKGFKAACEQYEILSLAIDSWCNDYVLLTKSGAMLAPPRNYRDPRTNGWVERAFSLMPKRDLYGRAGQQFARFETCYHLLAESEESPELLGCAEKLIFLPDYLSYLLGAKKYTEYTIASVTGLFNISLGHWDADILKAYNIPPNIFCDIIAPGTLTGSVRPEIAARLNTPATDIYAVASHDTACAVAAMPTDNESERLFISSGTWSIVGAETELPVLNEEAMENGFGNEGGVYGTIRFLKNVTGLWIIQECAKSWAARGNRMDFAKIADMAEKARKLNCYIDPDDGRFFDSGDMPEKVLDYCKGQPDTPQNEAEIANVIFTSLAFKYRYVIEQTEKLLGKKFSVIHVLGGGCNNGYLNRLTADACSKRVCAGPAEATAYGNAALQMIGAGEIKNLTAARKLIRNSANINFIEPKNSELADNRYRDFLKATGLG